MRKYNVFVEIRGKQIKVGKIEGSSYEDACFSYDEDYLSENGKAVSISLPLQVKPFSMSRKQTSLMMQHRSQQAHGLYST